MVSATCLFVLATMFDLGMMWKVISVQWSRLYVSTWKRSFDVIVQQQICNIFTNDMTENWLS